MNHDYLAFLATRDMENDRRNVAAIMSAIRWARAPHVEGPETEHVADLRSRVLAAKEWIV